jgi:hypothetical protein
MFKPANANRRDKNTFISAAFAVAVTTIDGVTGSGAGVSDGGG